MAHLRLNSLSKTGIGLTVPLLLSACAYTHGITPQEEAVRDSVAVDQFMPATREMRDNIETQELFAQAAFWSHEYELNPADLEATLKLAAAVRKLGNPSHAVEITQTSRALHPRDPYLLAEHAAGLIADQRALDAIPVLDQGLRIAPGYGRLWSLKGAALDQMENYEAARQNYSRALQITPNDPNVLTNLGLSFALSGDLQTAETWLRRAASIPGSGASARQNLAMVLQLQGRTQEAERELRLSNLSRGDRRLPPEPVPAFTPQGTPAQLSSNTPSRGIPSQSVPTQAYSPTSPYARNVMPSTQLTTSTPDGQPFTSSSQAARQTAQGSSYYRQPSAAPSAAPTQPFGSGPMTTEQQSVLNSIRQSLQPGAVTPPQTQGGSQPYVVGPRIQTPAQAPQAYAPVPQNTGQYAAPNLAYPSQPYSAPQTQPSSGLAGGAPQGRDPARRRR